MKLKNRRTSKNVEDDRSNRFTKKTPFNTSKFYPAEDEPLTKKQKVKNAFNAAEGNVKNPKGTRLKDFMSAASKNKKQNRKKTLLPVRREPR